jgi:hypothetical protein
MPADRPDQVQWDKVATELRAAREAQRRTWGDIDNTTLGRYLADEATSNERAEVESAVAKLPELKLLTDLVRDVLTDCAPAAPQTAVTGPVAAPRSAPTLPFRRLPAFPERTRWVSFRQHAALFAAAGLILAVGAAMFWTVRPNSSPDVPSLTSKGPALASNVRPDRPDPLRMPAARRQDSVQLVFTRVEELQRQIEENDKKGDADTALAAASDYVRVADNTDLENDRRFAQKVAAGWNRVGLLYQKEGDIDQAELALARANTINRKTLGENHEATRQTCYHLAGVYQGAVANPYGGQAAMTMHYGGAPMYFEHVYAAPADKAKRSHDSYARFHDRMNRPEMQRQVRESVLPVLVKALKDARTAPERARLAVAIGNLGPLAHDAQPLVIDCLREANAAYAARSGTSATILDPVDVGRLALVHALNQLGAPTDDAVPVLVNTFKNCDVKDLRQSVASCLVQAKAGTEQLIALAASGKPGEKEVAREALQRPRGGR